jgi:hypothetical protein
MYLVAVFNPVIPDSPYGFASFIVITQLFCFIPPLLIYGLVIKPKKPLSFKPITLMNAVFIVLMCLFIQPAMMMLSALSMIFFENPVTGLLSDFTSTPLWVSLIVMAVMPSVLEEITMRGVVQSNYAGVPLGRMALMNGLLFGILHLNPQQFLYAMLLGIIFAYYMHYTDSLWAPILGHFTINATQIIFATTTMRIAEAMPESQLALEAGGGELFGAIVSLVILNLLCLPAFLVLFKSFIEYNKRRMVIAKCTGAIAAAVTAAAGETETNEAAPDRVADQGFDWALIAVFAFYFGYLWLL